MFRVKRVYEEPSSDDGERILVERLWPRGLTKERARVDLWLKDIAPSRGLRQWFAHDASKWCEFCDRYERELDINPEVVAELWKLGRESRVTLVYAAHDDKHNSALALKAYLERHFAEGP